jgi:Putative mono-oxygenase ydhR
MHALVVTYGLRGVSAVEHAELGEQLAPAYLAVPGLLSRTGLENAATGRYGAVYLFESEAALQGFVASELYAVTHEHPGLAALAASEFSITDRGSKHV